MTEPSYTPSTARIRWDYAELALRHAGKPYEEGFAEFDQWLDQVRADSIRNPYREP